VLVWPGFVVALDVGELGRLHENADRLSADGIAIERVASELGVAIMTVKPWHRRYAEAGTLV
jgi:transposase